MLAIMLERWQYASQEPANYQFASITLAMTWLALMVMVVFGNWFVGCGIWRSSASTVCSHVGVRPNEIVLVLRQFPLVIIWRLGKVVVPEFPWSPNGFHPLVWLFNITPYIRFKFRS